MDLITELLLAPPASQPTFRLNYTSCASFLTGFPFVNARGLWFGIKGINERLYELLFAYKANDEGRVRQGGGCCFMMDYVESERDLCRLIVSFNEFP